MYSADPARSVDFAVFSGFIRRSLFPFHKQEKAFRSSLQLVRSHNTHLVCSASSKEEAHKKASTIDLTDFGYFQSADYELKFEYSSQSSSHSVYVVPVSVYPLLDDIRIPNPPDKRSRIYLEFFSDELERIRIRAEKVISRASSSEAIRLYAVRNLQLARKLFHDTSILFHSCHAQQGASKNNSDTYIIYTLNLFLIRTIVFFSDFFSPFLSEPPVDEEKLRSTLHNELPTVFKYPWLFDQRPALYQTLSSILPCSVAQDPSTAYNDRNSSKSADQENHIPDEVQALMQLKGSFKLNCNTNVFADIFYQLLHEKKEGENPFLEADSSKLVEVLSFFFSDKSGANLNPHTLKSMFKPSNFSKRPNKEDPRKLNI